MTATAVHRRQITDEVADDLRSQIMTGRLRPGDFVRLDETANAFGCSVTPVREALVTLRGEGLVRSSPHRGFIVESLERRDIVDIFWIQAELSARLAVRAADDPDLHEHLTVLESIVERLETAVEGGDADAVVVAEFDFHRQVNLMAHSKKAAWFLAAASRYSPNDVYAGDREWGEGAVRSHRRLIAHLASDDKAAIVDEIRAQFADARERLLRRLDAAGAWTAQP